MTRAEDRLRQAVDVYRQKGRRWYGLLGDHDGVVEVYGRPGFYYVRLRQAGSSQYTVGTFRGHVQPWYNLPVIVEEHPVTGEQYISGPDRTLVEYGQYNDPENYEPPEYGLEPHNDTHEFGGPDALDWLDTRQLYALRLQPTGNACEVLLQAGVYSIGGSIYFLADAQTVDLTAYAPADAGAHTWVLLYLDPEGTVLVQDVGAVYSEKYGAVYRLGTPPSNTCAVGLVRVQAATAPGWGDLPDLRMIPRANSGGGTTFIGDVTEVLDIDFRPESLLGGTQVNSWQFQQFQPTRAGRISRLAVLFGQAYAGGELTLHEGPTGADPQVGRGAIPPVTAGFSSPRWQEIVLDAPVAVTTGTQYTWMVSGTSGLRDTGGNLYADGRRGRNKDYLSPVEANYDFYFKLWLLVQDEAIPYLWFGPGVVGVHGANITLSEGATVDGVDVSTLSNAFAALEHAYQLENRRLWGRVQRLERRLAALEAQVDLDLTEHITH